MTRHFRWRGPFGEMLEIVRRESFRCVPRVMVMAIGAQTIIPSREA